MKITLATTAGFCFGVDRAVSLVYELLAQGKKVCTLGPIIHNPQLVDELSRRGVKIVEKPAQADKEAVLVIRTHGVPLSVVEEIKALEMCIRDRPVTKTRPTPSTPPRTIRFKTNETARMAVITRDALSEAADAHPATCVLRLSVRTAAASVWAAI